MIEIDRNAPVLVTGATGYVASWIVKRLLEQGRTVHATTRDVDNRDKLSYLRDLEQQLPGRIKFFEADLLDIGSFELPMQGCELVYHTASPFLTNVANPQRQLVEPAVQGTRNVLSQACLMNSVRRVVLTSSIAAIYGNNTELSGTPNGMFTEENWNSSSSLKHGPYAYSKTMAERAAWEIADSQSGWDLVVINPSLVIGPGINPNGTSESFRLMSRFGNGSMKSGVPNLEIGVVDVRDVAEAHIRVGLTPHASGRYIVSGHNTSFPRMAELLLEKFGDDFLFPKRTAPKWLVWLFGPMVNRSLTRRMVMKNIGTPFRADNSRGIRELGLRYHSLEASLFELFQQMVEHELVLPVAESR